MEDLMHHIVVANRTLNELYALHKVAFFGSPNYVQETRNLNNANVITLHWLPIEKQEIYGSILYGVSFIGQNHKIVKNFFIAFFEECRSLGLTGNDMIFYYDDDGIIIEFNETIRDEILLLILKLRC